MLQHTACRRLTRNGAISIVELTSAYGMSCRCARSSCAETSNRLGVDEIHVAHQTLRGTKAISPAISPSAMYIRPHGLANPLPHRRPLWHRILFSFATRDQSSTVQSEPEDLRRVTRHLRRTNGLNAAFKVRMMAQVPPPTQRLRVTQKQDV
jgi:hypothetical protein